MKTKKDHEKFIALRVEGQSIEKASYAVGISKRTGLKWDKEHSDIIKVLQTEGIEELADRIRLSRSKRLARIGSFLDRVDEELDKRKLDNVTTNALVSMKLRMLEVVGSILDAKKVELDGGINLSNTASTYEMIISRCVKTSPEDHQEKG